MSFVGTRPEVVKYVKKYKPEYFATLLLPAGITSEASIKYKDEAELLDAAEDVDEVYITKVLPEKMKYNLSKWTSLENASSNAFYYKYIVKFIQAYEEGTLETSSKVQTDLNDLLVDLRNSSEGMLKITIPFEWFSDYGLGLRRLISNSELSQMDRMNAIKT